MGYIWTTGGGRGVPYLTVRNETANKTSMKTDRFDEMKSNSYLAFLSP